MGKSRKDRHAVALGKRRLVAMTAERRREVARLGGQARAAQRAQKDGRG